MHDIGKNIVGVVLQCNNYEVIDLGVMVPCAKILETARPRGADMIGLSGLITPSLEEMAFVASEMERAGLHARRCSSAAPRPRARTPRSRSRRTTAGPSVHVLDASRAVGVAWQPAERRAAGSLRRRGARPTTRRVRVARAGRGRRSDWRADRGRARPTASPIDWTAITAAAALRSPASATLDDYPLAELVDRHRLDAVLPDLGARGHLPGDPRRTRRRRGGARACSPTRRRCSTGSCAERLLDARAVFGFWPANAVGDDIEIYADDTAPQTRAVHPHPAAADGRRQPAGPTSRSPTSSRPRTAAWPTTSAPSR